MTQIFFKSFFILSIILCVPLFSMEEQIKAKKEKLIKNKTIKKSVLDKALEGLMLQDLKKIVADYSDDWFCSKKIQVSSEIHRIKQLPDGRLIYTLLDGSGIKIVDPSTGESDELIGEQEDPCMEFDYSADQLVFNSGDGVKTLNLTSGSVEDLPTEHENIVKKLHFFDTAKVASGAFDNKLKTWDISTKKSLHTFSEHTGGIGAIENLSKDVLISGSGDSTVKIWDLRQGTKSIKTFKGHDNTVHDIVILSDKLIASCSQDGTIKIWNLETGKCIKILKNHNFKPIHSIAKLLDPSTLASSDDKRVKIWDLNSENYTSVKEGHAKDVVSLCPLKDGQIASGSWDKSIKIWSNPVANLDIYDTN